jgi:ubiquinone/menaquinone biosynthesis C-methylase UbiE
VLGGFSSAREKDNIQVCYYGKSFKGRTMDILTEKLSHLHGGKILDVATGAGNFLDILIKSFADFTSGTGIDTTDRGLDTFRGTLKGEQFNFITMDAEHLTFPDSCFDTVAISNSLHHLNEPDAVLAEMLRVLNPGGLFIMLEMYHDNQEGKRLNHVLVHDWWAHIHTLLNITHNRTYLRQELKDMANRLGLVNLEILDRDPEAGYEEEEDEEDNDFSEFFKTNEDLLTKVADKPEYESIKAEWEDIKARILRDGFANSIQLLAIGRKK